MLHIFVWHKIISLIFKLQIHVELTAFYYNYLHIFPIHCSQCTVHCALVLGLFSTNFLASVTTALFSFSLSLSLFLFWHPFCNPFVCLFCRFVVCLFANLRPVSIWLWLPFVKGAWNVEKTVGKTVKTVEQLQSSSRNSTRRRTLIVRFVKKELRQIEEKTLPGTTSIPSRAG